MSGSARADELDVGTSEVVVDISDSTGKCPSADQILRAIRRTVRSAPDPSAPARVKAVIESDATGSRARVVVEEDRSARQPAALERSLAASSCRALSEAVVLVVAQTIDPLSDSTVPAPIESDRASPVPSAPATAPPPVVPPAPARATPRLVPPPPVTPLRYGIGASVGLAMLTGLFPSAASAGEAGVAAHVRGGIHRWLELQGSALLPQDLAVGEGRVTFRALEGRLVVCPHAFAFERVELAPCIGFADAWVRAAGSSFGSNGDVAFNIPAIVLGAQARVPLGRLVVLRVDVGVGVTLRRVGWEVAPFGDVHRVAPVTFRLRFGLDAPP